MLMVWEGGLASHGGAIGILTALFIYARRHPDQPYLWRSDGHCRRPRRNRICGCSIGFVKVIVVALAGLLIRSNRRTWPERPW